MSIIFKEYIKIRNVKNLCNSSNNITYSEYIVNSTTAKQYYNKDIKMFITIIINKPTEKKKHTDTVVKSLALLI